MKSKATMEVLYGSHQMCLLPSQAHLSQVSVQWYSIEPWVPVFDGLIQQWGFYRKLCIEWWIPMGSWQQYYCNRWLHILRYVTWCSLLSSHVRFDPLSAQCIVVGNRATESREGRGGAMWISGNTNNITISNSMLSSNHSFAKLSNSCILRFNLLNKNS